MCFFGVLLGLFNYSKTVHNWSLDENTNEKTYAPYDKSVPRIESVSCWDFYLIRLQHLHDREYVIQRHRFNREQLYDLLNDLSLTKAIEAVLEEGPNMKNVILKVRSTITKKIHKMKDFVTVLEYWGIMDTNSVEDAGLEIPADAGPSIQVNAWLWK